VRFAYFGTVCAALCLGLVAHASAASTTYRGVTFPAGDVSFADRVVSTDTGELAPTNAGNLIAERALGAPDRLARSLGRGGNIVVEFTNNALTGSGNSDDDLFIFEIGGQVEDTFVEISRNGIDWLDVGKVFGSTSRIDIDPVLQAENLSPLTNFFFVRLTDDPNEGGRSGQFVGADIDAVGAISTTLVPVPAALPLFASGIAGFAALRRFRRKA